MAVLAEIFSGFMFEWTYRQPTHWAATFPSSKVLEAVDSLYTPYIVLYIYDFSDPYITRMRRKR